jgi:RNA polymerase sigma factor (sigma-70 family)
MVSALTRIFGLHNLELAEDVVQDALCRALEVWKYGAPPENPSAWLMAAAKNRAIDVLRKNRTVRRFAPDISDLVETEWALLPTISELFQEHELADDQLRMMFSCCHPQVSAEGQTVLILHVLSGFGVGEIAGAFLSSPAAVEKRLARAKKTLAASGALFEVSGEAAIRSRIEAVHGALYLLFNEGYHGSHPHVSVRAELCEEAMRLTSLMLAHPPCALPETRALLALMCLHAARLPTRLDQDGDLNPLEAQDRSRWDPRLIERGLALLDESARGPEVSEYHLEAAIAAQHVLARTCEATDWGAIVGLYDSLYARRPSPVVALNRAIALGQLHGPKHGIEALRGIEGRDRLLAYPFYPAALGELCRRAGHSDEAKRHFEAAIRLARNPAERRFLERKLAGCE